MAKQDRYLEKLARVPMFQACNKKEITTIGRLGDTIPFKTGDTLVREGDRGREFFVIVDGKMRVTRGGIDVADLGPGDYFGELALLDGGPRTADVVATTPLQVLVLGQREFTWLLDEVPGLTLKVLRSMAQRVRELDQKIYP